MFATNIKTDKYELFTNESSEIRLQLYIELGKNKDELPAVAAPFKKSQPRPMSHYTNRNQIKQAECPFCEE